ncbi:MAG: cystathionine gamma-synthase [Myxococcales bacterium]|nr:cystathionine gamma-synthase [Myxococcales bacterium]
MTHLSSRTRAVRAAIASDGEHGAVVPPIHLSSNFTFAGLGQKRRYDYTRSGNPTRDHLADALADLEGGAGASITATGMGAITAALSLGADGPLPAGARVLAPHDCYGGTYRLLAALDARGVISVDFVDQTDDVALRAALERGPRLVWIETPSNPLLRVTDIAAVAAAAHARGALVVADNTFLSPVLQRPLELGADLVVHSTTKYINGHSDVVGGALVARDAALAERVAWWVNCLGLSGAPFDAYLTLRGLRTLHLRMQQHEANARAVLEHLRGHAAVARVYHPSLPDHRGHAIAARQQRGFGPMLSFELHADARDSFAVVDAFTANLRCFSLAESLGGVESLVAHPASMTHAAMTPEARQRAGIGDALLRLSVGVEAAEDLVADLRAALEAAQRVAGRRAA